MDEIQKFIIHNTSFDRWYSFASSKDPEEAKKNIKKLIDSKILEDQYSQSLELSDDEEKFRKIDILFKPKTKPYIKKIDYTNKVCKFHNGRKTKYKYIFNIWKAKH